MFFVCRINRLEAHGGWWEAKHALWFHKKLYHSVAGWLLYFLECALWTQFDVYIKNKPEIINSKDFHSVFIGPENTRIRLKEEILPYWK